MSETSDYSKSCLGQIPYGVLALDEQGTIRWANQALEQMIGLPKATLIGKSHETLEQPGHTGLFKGTGLMRLSSLDPENERWLDCTVIETSNPQAPGHTLKFFQDVTELVQLREENERLRQQVQELAITDELTGLANRRALNNSLNAQVTRSRRYNNPLSLVAVELVDTTRPANAIDNDTILATSRYLRDRLRWVDIIGRWDHNQFFIVLPETNSQDGSELLNKIVSEFPAVNAQGNAVLQLHFGLAEWQKGYDTRKLMQLAADAMPQTATA